MTRFATVRQSGTLCVLWNRKKQVAGSPWKEPISRVSPPFERLALATVSDLVRSVSGA
jgi:hypothetical protein